MSGNGQISNYLTDVHHDWLDSRDAFSLNTYPASQWPIPFFGNPNTALVATVGVNPSSGEFAPRRNWGGVASVKDWKLRLKSYFNHTTLAHEWFESWSTGLALLNCSYKDGTGAHFDVSYRATRAMLRNPATDRREFSHMVNRDVAWFFRLLLLCPNLRGLLVFGPVVRHDGSTESLAVFIRKSAPRHGFSILPDGGLRFDTKGLPARSFFLHEVAAPGAGTIVEQVVTNLTQHRTNLLRSIHPAA